MSGILAHRPDPRTITYDLPRARPDSLSTGSVGPCPNGQRPLPAIRDNLSLPPDI